MFYRLSLTLTKHTSFTIVPSTMSTYCSSFKPWVLDINLNKSLEPMSDLDTPYKYFLHSKSSFNSICPQFILLTHSRMQPTFDKILKSIIYIIL